MKSDTAGAQRRALGDFLRARRERLTPAMAGLEPGARRRTPGLRREEVAQLGGLSATWLSWIEQGREVSVSPHALARLARALQLSAAERGYLFELAARRDPDARAATGADEVPRAMQAVVDAIAVPAYLLDRGWTARAWNAAAARLFLGWLDGAGDGHADRNLLRFIFTSPAACRLICDWEARARRVLAEFRADTSRHLDDPGLRALVEDLRQASSLFDRVWREQSVTAREGGERGFNHPREGLLVYEQVTFALAGRSELKLVLLVPMQPHAPARSGAAAPRCRATARQVTEPAGVRRRK
jgi:transcriptional regulator with XRE-family HTH domain